MINAINTGTGKSCANQLVDQVRHGALDYGTLDNTSLHGVNEMAGFGVEASLQIFSTAPFARGPRPPRAPDSFRVALGLSHLDKKAAKKAAAQPVAKTTSDSAKGPKFFHSTVMRNSQLAPFTERLFREASIQSSLQAATPRFEKVHAESMKDDAAVVPEASETADLELEPSHEPKSTENDEPDRMSEEDRHKHINFPTASDAVAPVFDAVAAISPINAEPCAVRMFIFNPFFHSHAPRADNSISGHHFTKATASSRNI